MTPNEQRHRDELARAIGLPADASLSMVFRAAEVCARLVHLRGLEATQRAEQADALVHALGVVAGATLGCEHHPDYPPPCVTIDAALRAHAASLAAMAQAEERQAAEDGVVEIDAYIGRVTHGVDEEDDHASVDLLSLSDGTAYLSSMGPAEWGTLTTPPGVGDEVTVLVIRLRGVIILRRYLWRRFRPDSDPPPASDDAPDSFGIVDKRVEQLIDENTELRAKLRALAQTTLRLHEGVVEIAKTSEENLAVHFAETLAASVSVSELVDEYGLRVWAASIRAAASAAAPSALEAGSETGPEAPAPDVILPPDWIYAYEHGGVAVEFHEIESDLLCERAERLQVNPEARLSAVYGYLREDLVEERIKAARSERAPLAQGIVFQRGTLVSPHVDAGAGSASLLTVPPLKGLVCWSCGDPCEAFEGGAFDGTIKNCHCGKPCALTGYTDGTWAITKPDDDDDDAGSMAANLSQD